MAPEKHLKIIICSESSYKQQAQNVSGLRREDYSRRQDYLRRQGPSAKGDPAHRETSSETASATNESIGNSMAKTTGKLDTALSTDRPLKL
ncbi:hypothetical protein ACJ72_03678 [Emergomyces africanus]|uniref:Uncharacterized protein n=1 Tax=Emergomyces africanus TaxID=1955775 RepID=A0A1B7NYW3_9EURO|nr:hypothetical protein ACJ72_03678 [Emergomyces africanus]